MNRKLLNGLLVLTVAAGGVGTFTSCKDEDFRNDLQLEQTSLEAQIKAIREISDTEFDANLQEWLNKWTARIDQGNGNEKFNSYPELVAAAATMKDFYNKILAGNYNDPLTKQFAENLWNYLYNNHVKELTDGLEAKIAANTVRIAALETALAAQQIQINDLISRMTSVEGKVLTLEQAVEALGGRVAQLEADYAAILQRVVTLEQDVLDLDARVTANEQAIAMLSDELDILSGKVNVIEGQVYSLEEAMKLVQENLGNLMTAFAEYQVMVDRILANLLDRASSVGISQTYNPVFGSINLPVGVNSMVLAAYEYKSNEGSFNFPADAMMHMADDSPFLFYGGDDAKWSNILAQIAGSTSQMTPSGVAFSEAQEFGNMGGAVVTINPYSVDFTNENYKIELVDSELHPVLSSEDGGITLDNYEGKLTFGANYSRGEDHNGVYALNANAHTSNYTDLLVDIDKSNLKDALKEAINNKSIADMAKLGKTVFEAVNNKLPAYAVKVSWMEEEEAENEGGAIYAQEVENYVLSDFSLAAVVAHPLSYGANIGKFIPSGKHLKHISPLTEYIDRIKNKLTLSFDRPQAIDPVEIYIDVRTVETENGQYVTKVFFYKDQAMTEPIGEGYYTVDGIYLTDDQLTSLANALVSNYNNLVVNSDVVDSINKAIADINSALDSFEGKVEDIQDLLDRAKNNQLLTYADKIVDFYNRIADRVNNFLASPNFYLQAMMAYSAGDGPHHLSTLNSGANRFNYAPGKGVMLYPTSYTGDIVVPSFWKWVAITEVDGDVNKVGNLNGGVNAEYLNKVLPGHIWQIPFNFVDGMQGHTLTLTYVSVDYRGKCSMQNYYIKVY